MKNQIKTLSETRISRLRAQGYFNESAETITQLAFGIRFAYRLCVLILITAIVTQNLHLFYFLLGMAGLGSILKNHPFDYIYNYGVRTWMHTPPLPPRSKQLKFACSIATLWLTLVVYLLHSGMTSTGLSMAAFLAGVAFLPSTIDLCIPSMLYNAMFRIKISNRSL